MAQEPYPMLRNSHQTVRVTMVQYLWRETLGYLVHPQIPPISTRIADVATATGLWLCDVNSTRPTCEVLDGYDISPASFIAPRDLPSKVTLTALDATGVVPESLRGKYDVVHLRLVQPGVPEGDPALIITHCMELLRPGGYLQWEEFDPTKIDLHIADGVSRPSGLEQVAQMIQSRGHSDWIEALPDLLEKRGMSVVAVEKKREAPWHRQVMTHLICHVMNEIVHARVDVVGPPGLGDTMRAHLAAALQEASQGSYASYLFQVVVAQKRL